MSWTDIIGQDRVKRILKTAIQENRLPHAYLFHGPEGAGQDAMALELARVLHCDLRSSEACGRCPSCLRASTLQHPDINLIFALPVGKNEESEDGPLARLSDDDMRAVREQLLLKSENSYHRIEIPRATVIKITSVREIRRHSVLSSSGGKRIFIIVNADELGDAAANTLLKTLEEPSPNAMLILTTSHREALLPTILSRCQAIRFDPLSEEEILDALKRRSDLPEERALVLARLANGSYTKALEMQEEDVDSLRGDVLSFIRLAAAPQPIELCRMIEEIAAKKDRDLVVRFLSMMMVWFRDALVLPLDGRIINLDQQKDLDRFLEKLPGADIPAVLDHIEEAIFLVERNVYITLVLVQLSIRLRKEIRKTI